MKTPKRKDHSRSKPINKNCKRILLPCFTCGGDVWEKPSSAAKKKRNFCCMECYSKFKRTKLHFTEQPAYKGIRKEGQSKQVYHRNYCKRHPKRIAHLKARRYASEKNSNGSHTFQQWSDMQVEFDFKCAFCRKTLPLTKDHIIPLSDGGSDYIDNIQPLCRSCNSKKWKHVQSPDLIRKRIT